jgi:hypothetical protein
MLKYFPIYEEAVRFIEICNCSILNFLIYEENFLFFFISVVIFCKVDLSAFRRLTMTTPSLLSVPQSPSQLLLVLFACPTQVLSLRSLAFKLSIIVVEGLIKPLGRFYMIFAFLRLCMF